jgi:hypothetical protein
MVSFFREKQADHRYWILVNIYSRGRSVLIRRVTGQWRTIDRNETINSNDCSGVSDALHDAEHLPAVKLFQQNPPTEIMLSADDYEFVSGQSLLSGYDRVPSVTDITTIGDTPVAQWIDRMISIIDRCIS